MSEPLPILLAHGIARFDELRAQLRKIWKAPIIASGDNLHYFRGIRSRLREQGFNAHHAHVPFAASVADRANELRRETQRILQETGAERLHIIAHSMGGLDARRMIADCKETAKSVASLSTIGTPHLGTAFADIALAKGGDTIVSALSRILSLEGFKDLTRPACATFNDSARAAETANDVVYQTWSSIEPDEKSVFLPLRPSWKIIHAEEDENDGLVSETSQAWTDELCGTDGKVKQVAQHRFPFYADHWNQIGWWHPNRWSLSDGLFGVKAQIDEYERQVGEVYLEIANSVSGIS